MENAGNAVIDFGRFFTGFLVVMGIGTLSFFMTWDLASLALQYCASGS